MGTKGFRGALLSILVIASLTVPIISHLSLSLAFTEPDQSPPLGGGNLVIVQSVDANTLDVHRTKLDWAYQVIALVHDTLMTFDWEMRYIPLLAESWEVDPDGFFIDYHLRRNVKFHCGHPFNADAVVYSIRRCKEPWSAHADSVKNVLDAERLDEYTVRIHLKQWDRWLYDWFATTSSSIVCPRCAKEHGLDYGEKYFCGTGPFKVKEWIREDRLLLERNENYRWGPEIYQNRGPAHLEGITFEVIPTDISREEKFKRGEADMMVGISPRPPLIDWLNTTEGVIFIINARSSMSYVGFHVGTLSPEIQQGIKSGRPYPPGAKDSPVSDDPEGKGLLVRKALLYATHRENIVLYAWEGMGKVAYGPLTSVIWGYNPAVEDMYPYDPEMARSLLVQAGYADGLELTVLTTNYEPYTKTAQVLKEQWAKVGVTLNIEVRAFDDIEGIIASAQHDLWIGGWTWHNADMIWWYWHTIRVPPASNRFWWGSAYTDALIDNTFHIDDDVTYYAIQESQRLIMEDAAYLPVVERPFLLAHWDRVKGFTMHPLSNLVWKHLDTCIGPSHGPILIVGNDDFTPANGVVGGSGTENDPYIIENWDISAGSANGIEIQNTTAYFIIRNCYVHDGGDNHDGISFYNVTNGVLDNNIVGNNLAGIGLYSSDNNTLDNNICSNNYFCGIFLNSSSNNTISNNIAENSQNNHGIELHGNSDNNTVSNNTCSNNYQSGIFLNNSSNNTICNNIMENNSHGIFLGWCSDNNTLTNNSCDNNLYNGIQLNSSNNNLISNNIADNNTIFLNNSSNNLIENNTCKNSFVGIYLRTYSNNNTLTNNTCENNDFGIQLHENSNNNLIENNTCSNNSDSGIALDSYSNNNTLNNNTCENNSNGIILWSSDNNRISGNIVENNSDSGINLWNLSNNNTISGNICSNNYYFGISLFDSSNNTISNNIAENTKNILGIFLENSNNNLIENNTVRNNQQSGIQIYLSSNNTISNNIVEDSRTYEGILIQDSEYNLIDNNTCSNNPTNGITLYQSSNNLINNNLVENNYYQGIRVERSPNNRISNNIVENTRSECGIFIWDSDNNLIENNTTKNNNISGIYLNYSNNNLISNNIAENNRLGIELYNYSDNNTISGNICSNNLHDGITLVSSDRNLISNNTCKNNDRDGIDLYYIYSDGYIGSDNNTLDNNTCSNNSYGIYMSDSDINTITNNTCSFNNSYGIYIRYSLNNRIFHNNFVNNAQQARDGDTNYWDNGYPSGGNYWSDYTGADDYRGENQDIPGSDGIGDTPYDIPGDKNQDRYPLMFSWSPPDYVYLTWASPDPAHTINVSWRTDGNYVGEVRYDTEPRAGGPDAYSDSAEGTGGVTTAKFDGYIHHVELTGLEPYSTYYFICGNPDYGWSEELSFRTAPVEKRDIRFVAGGDSRSDARPDHPHPDWPEARDGVSQLMASYDPDFVIFTGDFLWNGETQEGGLDTWDNWLGAWYKYARAEDGRLIPIVPAIGNHELVYPAPSDYVPDTHASNYYMLFNLPRNERWYSLNWGPDLHIVILDGEIGSTESESWTDQLEWLRQDLLEHWDDPWKIAAAHRPAFTSGHYSGDANIQRDWIPEFDFYHVDLYFSGHDHNYQRTHPINLSLSEDNYQTSPENGTIYFVSAGWGAPLYGGSPKWWTAYGPDGRYHFTLVDVYENGTLHLRPVSLGGQVFDELIIQKERWGCLEAPYYEVISSVTWVVDGDTIDVWVENIVVDLDPAGEVFEDTAERVRFGGGVDAPELGEPGSVEAKELVENLIPSGTTVYLDLNDLSVGGQTGRPYRGYWERLIAVVYVELDGQWINVNAELLRWGLEAYPDHDWLKYVHYPSEWDPYEWLEENYPYVRDFVPVDVSISPSYQSGMPGATLTYTVNITNTCDVSNVYDLSVSDSAGWTPTISPSIIMVGAGENKVATLSVAIPENAVPCTEDNITVTATSQTDNTVNAEDSCTAHVTSFIPAYPIIVEGSDASYNKDWYPEIPPSWVYESKPPVMEAKKIGSGAVVAAGFGRATNGGIAYPTQRWETGELDVLFDKAFQWMKEGATNVLWYGHYEEGATTYNRLVYNYADRGSWLIDSLRTKGYTVDNTVGTADLITSSLLAPYEILVIPQLQGGPTGGDPNLLPDDAVVAIKDFVEGGGGLFIMESGDYDGYNYCKIQNKVLEALNFGLFFQHDTIFDPESDDERYITAIVTTDEFGPDYIAETGKNTIKLYKVASLGLPEPGVEVGIAPRYQASVPGSTLTFTVSVFNKDEVEDTYSLTVDDDLGWGLSLLETSLSVPGRQTREATLSVTIPIGAAIGAEDNIVVTATSTVKAGVSDTDSSIVRAARIITPPIDDAYTHEARATTKFGDRKTLYTGWYDDGSERAWLKFDLSGLPADLSIGKAKLWVYNYFLTEGGSSGVRCHRVDDDDWSEGTMTWDSQPTYGTQLDDPVPVTDTGWFSWDVTSFVQEEFGGDKKVSFSLIDIEEDTEVDHSTWFASKEYDDPEKWPYLEIPLPYAVDVAIKPWIQDTSPGGTLTYTVIVKNVGTESDSYSLSVTDTQGWGPVIAQNLFTNVQYGESRTTTLAVTIPSDAPPCTKDTITVTATSQADPSVSDSYSSIAHAFVGEKLLPTDDAHVSSGYQDINYGGEDTLYLRSDTRDFKNQRIFLKFDLSMIPSGSTITEAEVWLWGRKAELADINAQCWSVTDDVFLDEDLMTWGTQPGLGALLDTVDLKYSPPSEDMWVLWDVTDFVRNEFAGDKTASFGIKPEVESASGRYRFNSKEWSGTDKDPHLKISYTTAPTFSVSPADFTVVDAPPLGEPYLIEQKLAIYNGDDIERFFVLSVLAPPPEDLKPGFEPIPNENWIILLPALIGIEGNSSETVDIILNIPRWENLTSQRWEAWLSVKRMAQPGELIEIELISKMYILTTEELPPLPVGVEVSISPESMSGAPGETLTYTVTVVNTGNVEDTYDLTVTDSLAWGATVSPTSLTIAAGASDTATLTVTIPEDAENGTEDNITVTATSTENVEVSDSASCIAQAVRVGPIPRAKIVMYVDNGHSINNTSPPPIVWYEEGDHIPIIVSEELADGGRVVSAGVIYGLRGYYGLEDYYWRGGEMDNLFDGIFQWLKSGASWVLWYEGDDVYYRNKISTSSDDQGCMAFADALRDDFGYTMDYSAALITPSLLEPYDILVLPQLQAMPSDDDITIIVNWVRGGGGLVILDESDYFVASAEINNAILEALGATHRFQHDQVNTGISIWSFYASVDASTEIGASYGAPTAHVASVCSIRVLARTVSVSISPKIRSGMPGTTLFEYEIIVTNGWENSDNFTLDVSDDAGWDLTIEPLETTIPGAGLDNTIRLTVTVPGGTPLGTVDNITVTVTSTTNSSIVDSDNCIARAAFVIYPTDDAYVRDDDPDGNYGGRYGLYVGRYGTAWQNAFMRFELSDIPADATIHEVGLYLWCYDAFGDTSVRVHPVDNDDWWEGTGTEGEVIEGAISWNDAPSFDSEVILDTRNVAIQYQVYHWDVTSFVADEYEGDKIVSLALTPPPDTSPSNNVSFTSKDWFVEGEHPYLAVYYTGPPTEWNALITATFPRGSDDAIFGVRPDATSGFDNAYDIPEPPPPVAPPYVRTFFHYPEQTPDKFHRSCLAPEDLMGWPLRVEYAEGLENITLTWNVEDVPADYSVYLYRGENLVADMMAEDSYTFEASTGSYDFRIVVGKIVPFTLELTQGWNMISFPVLPENSSPDAIFDGYYVLYRWDAEDKRYVLHADSGSFIEPDPDVEAGVGYWAYVLEDENVYLLGVPVNQLTLSLRQGWDLIGPPYDGSSIADPADDPDISVLPWAFTWNARERGYSMTQLLEAGKGYWVYAMRDCTLTLLPTRGEELDVNGDFSTGDATGWTFGFAAEPSYGSEPTYEIVNYTARIYRTGAGSTGRGGWLYQDLNVNVSDASELVLSCKVKVDYQSLSGTGVNSTEPPAFVEILYTGTDGQDIYRWWGFYYLGTSSNPWDEKIPQGTWFYRSYDLTTLSPKPVVIKRVYIGGSGWDYDASFDDVSLIYVAA